MTQVHPKNMASFHGLSNQLFFDVQMMVMGFIGLLQYMEAEYGIIAMIARKLNQDSLESLFGHLRFLCGGGSDPNIFKAVHALPTVEAQRGIKLTSARFRKFNSSKRPASPPAPAADPRASNWLAGHRIRVVDAHFAQVCSTARAAGARAEGHPVYWQTLREIQKEDERKMPGNVRGSSLDAEAEDGHPHQQNGLLPHACAVCYGSGMC